MIDISAVGAKIIVTKKSGGTITTITQFSDEGTPFECPDVDLSENAKNLNGEMISSRKPSVYTLSVTVIPGSDNDKELTKFFHKSALYPGNVQKIADLECGATITIPNQNESSESTDGGRKYVFANGRPKGMPTGPSTSAEGRQGARTFTFEFEQFQPFFGE